VSAVTPGTDVVTAPLPVAFQALLAKLTELADDRGIKLSEVAELAELTEAATSLLTRADHELIITAEAYRIADEWTAEGLAAGRLEWVDPEHTILRKRQPVE
jgi:hypothetical protein